MIYRWEILAKSGLYDGWAHNQEEMKGKFLADYPEDTDPYIFMVGSAPKTLNYAAYQKAQAYGLSNEQILVVEAYLNEMDNE